MDTAKVELLITTKQYSIVEYQRRVYILSSQEIVIAAEGAYTRLFFLHRGNMVVNTINARFLQLIKPLNELEEDLRYDAIELLEETTRGL
jgi:hypothetical protein